MKKLTSTRCLSFMGLRKFGCSWLQQVCGLLLAASMFLSSQPAAHSGLLDDLLGGDDPTILEDPLNIVNVSQDSAQVEITLPDLFIGNVRLVYEDEEGNIQQTTSLSVNIPLLGQVDVPITLNGLVPDTAYTVYGTATDLLGNVFQTVDSIIDTLPLPETLDPADVVTGNATGITTTTATLNGTLDPNGITAIYFFEYGKTTSYGSASGPIELAILDQGAQPVDAALTGLIPNTLYHYRLVAINGAGRTDGEDKTFTTLTVPVDPNDPNEGPDAVNDFAFPLGKTSVTVDVLENDVDPEGDSLSITAFTQGQAGTVSNGPNSTLVYTPGPFYKTSDVFTYTISDGEFTDTATVFVQDFLTATTGQYNGIIDNVSPSNTNTGYFRINVNKKGRYSGFVSVGGIRHAIKGSFDQNGSSTRSIRRRNQAPFSANLGLNPRRAAVDGLVNVDGFASQLDASKLLFNNKTNQAPYVGRYTMALQTGAGTGAPHGDGWALGSITKTGAVKVVGRLGDNTPFSTTALLKADGTFPFYAGLYPNKFPLRGSIVGTATIENPASATSGNLEVSGVLDWFKPAQASGFYAGGFTSTASIVGSRYVRPPKNVRMMTVVNPQGNVQVQIVDGNLPVPIVKTFIWAVNNKLTPVVVGLDDTRITMAPASGVMSGSFLDATSTRRKFRGIVTQKQKLASGLFTGVNQTGTVTIVEP